MKHVLSSRLTAFHRFGIPALMTALGIYVLALSFFSKRRDQTTGLFFFGLLIIVSGVVVFRVQRRLKRVWVDKGVLFVSDYRKEVEIPLSAIESMSETEGNFWWRRTPTRQVTISLNRDCEFGREIAFATRLELFKRPEGLELLEKLRSGEEI